MVIFIKRDIAYPESNGISKPTSEIVVKTLIADPVKFIMTVTMD